MSREPAGGNGKESGRVRERCDSAHIHAGQNLARPSQGAHNQAMDAQTPGSNRDGRSQQRGRAPLGFTLVELMLVMVIIGVLSSFAIPYFQRVTARARRTEAIMVLDKLRVHFINAYENTGSYGVAGDKGDFNPPNGGAPVGQPAEWSTAVSGWMQVPFAFEGGLKLRYRYDVAGPDAMTITVVGDMPGLGPTLAQVTALGLTGNYLYIESLQGAVVASPPFELPEL